jgi:hypothetical protein
MVPSKHRCSKSAVSTLRFSLHRVLALASQHAWRARRAQGCRRPGGRSRWKPLCEIRPAVYALAKHSLFLYGNDWHQIIHLHLNKNLGKQGSRAPNQPWEIAIRIQTTNASQRWTDIAQGRIGGNLRNVEDPWTPMNALEKSITLIGTMMNP